VGENATMKTPNDQEIRKFLQEKHDPQSQLEKLKSYSNAANLPLFNTDYHETYDVNILPDTKIAPAKFIPDPLRPNVFRAHPITIRAMRKAFYGWCGFYRPRVPANMRLM
jgi:hypothetical protein